MPRSRTESAKACAQSARKRPSVAEDLMWKALRSNRIGFKFRREHPIGNYRLDFYCAEAKLAVELDGEQHLVERDQLRDDLISEHQIYTHRIPNIRLFGIDSPAYLDEVLAIQRLCEARTGRKAFPQ